MKWYAGQNKTEQASVLAIVETLAASGVAIWFAVHYQTLLPFAISVLVAPLLLLRTRDSTALGIRSARRLDAWHDRKHHPVVVVIVDGLTGYLGPLAIRIGAMFTIMAKKPVTCVRAIPSNWWRFVGRIDSSAVPEPIPGWTGRRDLDHLRFFRLLWSPGSILRLPRSAYLACEDDETLRGDRAWFVLSTLFFFSGIFVLIHGPALFYRWALKSSWWVYCPLLWIILPARRPAVPGAHRRLIARVIDQPLVTIWSAVVIASVVAKIWIWQARTATAAWFDDRPLLAFFKPYIEPDSMPLWQWTALVNSVLAIAMYFVAKAALHAEEDEKPWPPELVDRGFRGAMIVRRALTVYAIAVMVAITARRGLPPVGAIWPV